MFVSPARMFPRGPAVAFDEPAEMLQVMKPQVQVQVLWNKYKYQVYYISANYVILLVFNNIWDRFIVLLNRPER